MELEHVTPEQELAAIEERLPALELQYRNKELDYASNGTAQSRLLMEEEEARVLALRERRDALAKKIKTKKS